MPRLPLLKLLGDASYSIYLSHTAAIVIGSFALHALKPGRPGTPAATAIPAGQLAGPATAPAVAAGHYLFMLAFCLGVGVLCHWLIERPATSFFRGLLSSPRAKTKAYQPG
jgi:peptidoglycan/LPS O-acetylase OafA/YrhL